MTNELFTFHANTPEAVKSAIIRAYNSRARVRVWVGDTTTGQAWAEEFDVLGKIGRSAGGKKIPLLIKNSRSFGGGALLDHCIVRIDTTEGLTLYKHPTFNPGKFVQCEPVTAGYVEAVEKDGVLHAQFKKPGAAARYIGFMTGTRYAK